MRLRLLYILLPLSVAWMPAALSAQDRCGTVEYNKSLHPDATLHRIRFEQWITEQRVPALGRQSRQEIAPYRIPVVVHVIHNGEAIGQGANISEEQILSQLRVLNADFRRLNADTVNTPSEFAAVAGRLDIEFVLARRDPEGIATNGIVRVDGGRAGWTIADNYALKELSYWPAEQYLNIWVANITDSHAGWAQFPESDLAGMENSSTNRLTDGVVLWHKAVGSVDDGNFTLDPAFNKGRTGTHEIGHFFGLNHIWGDDAECNGTDYVTDTPNQGPQTRGCPAHPKTDLCGEVIMFQNFLDYSDDDCMNLFTRGQIERMIVVLENSPRRNSLLTSPALQDPAPLPNDLGIRRIVFPDATACANEIVPVIEVRNYGSNTISSARIRFTLDGTVRETADFTLALDPLASAELAFSPLTVPSGSHSVTFQVLLTNGGTDAGAYNDEAQLTVVVPAFGTTPFVENLSAPPPGWIISNPDSQITWEFATAPDEDPANIALKLNYYNYEDNIGEIDAYISPVIDLSASPAATLTFDVAHARYQSSNDRLRVVVLTDCGDLIDGTIVYNKAGDSLKTAPATTDAFVPSGPGQWRREYIDLSAFIGISRVQIAFVGINNFGNNIYVDNIGLYTEETTDVALVQLQAPAVVTCEEEHSPRLLIRNAGSTFLTEVKVLYSVNGGATSSVTLPDINLAFGQEKEVALPVVNLATGENTLAVTLQDPNGVPDFNTGNNENTFTIVVSQAADRIPLRENFEADFAADWTLVNPLGGMNWEAIETNEGTSLYFNAYDNPRPGDAAWLVSPVLDFSRANNASMVFDLSYALGEGRRETLSILVSTDCGTTFREIIYNFPAAEVANGSWMPQADSDWTRNIPVNLNNLIGHEQVRIAFVVRNQQGNNMFVDNIEFYVESNPSLIEITDFYTIYGYDLSRPDLSDLRITFNLPDRQDVRYSIVTVTGQVKAEYTLTDVLNQTYPVSPGDRLTPGVYIVRVQIGERQYATRILVQ